MVNKFCPSNVLDERFYYVAISVTLYQHLPMNYCLERVDKGVDINRCLFIKNVMFGIEYWKHVNLFA